MIQQYRKKPITVDVLYFTDGTTYEELTEFLKCDHQIYTILGSNIPYEVIINTLEGDMECKWNTYIIKGIEGEFWPVKASIFEKTYERV